MKARVLYLIKFYLLTVLIFIVAKVAFMLCNASGHAFTAADVFDVVLHGLTLDFSTALYFLIVPFLLTIISLWTTGRWLYRIMQGYQLLIAIAFSLAFVADTSLYAFWQFKLDASWLQYLETPTEAMASVTTGYLVLRGFVIVLLILLIYAPYEKLFPTGGKNVSHGREKIFPRVGKTMAFLLLVPVIVIGIRGGLGESTTNIGQAYYSQNQFLNHSAVNPVFSFLYSLSHQVDDLDQYQYFSDDECRQIVSDVYTTASIGSDTLLTTTRPNILIILLESAGEQFASAMPHLQQLKREGVYFSRCYANSWRTDRGTVATLSGYPSFPVVSVMKIPEKSRTLPGIAKSLRTQGYQTSYLYGGDINFTNMRSYLISTGWDRLASMSDFSLEQQHSAQWGVRDDITFQYLYEQMVKAPADQPHLWGYSTLSSHEPWDVPLQRLDDEVENSFAYLDDCLYDFVGKLRQSPLWDHLLIVMIADHGIIHKQIDMSRPLQKNHIPMLWLGGAVRRPQVVSTLCNQSDLAATLLGQLRLPHNDYAFSRDVLSSTYVHPTAVNNYSNAQWITDSTGHVLYDFDTHRMDIAEAADTARLMRLNRAILQVTATDLQSR